MILADLCDACYGVGRAFFALASLLQDFEDLPQKGCFHYRSLSMNFGAMLFCFDEQKIIFNGVLATPRRGALR